METDQELLIALISETRNALVPARYWLGKLEDAPGSVEVRAAVERTLAYTTEICQKREVARATPGAERAERAERAEPAKPRQEGLLAEIEGEITHEHLPRSLELLNNAINVLIDALEVHASHIGPLPLDQLAVAEIDAVWAARAACRRLGVPLGWLATFGWRGARLSGK